jgi:hypothetical protein
MKLHKQGWAFVATVALVVVFASTALAIEAFQERFEWGDMSKPTTLQGRVIILDPYDEAVWINIAVFGGNAESGYFWQKIHPGKTLKFYADKGAWEELKKMARPHAGPAAAKEVPPASETVLVEFTAVETEQNHRVITNVKKLPEVAGAPSARRSISSLRLAECQGKSQMTDAACATAVQKLNTAPKGEATVGMQYDVLQPGGKPLAGLVPWTASYNTGGGGGGH